MFCIYCELNNMLTNKVYKYKSIILIDNSKSSECKYCEVAGNDNEMKHKS